MYTDLITHCPDTAALLLEVEQKAPEMLIKDDNDVVTGFSITKTPTVRNGKETLSVVRVNADELALIKSLSSMSILAEAAAYSDLLKSMTKASKTIYNRVYNQTPVDVLDDAGKVIGTTTPPALIGAFS